MICHVCQSQYQTNDNLVFRCLNCYHQYKKYNGNIIQYHKKEYRKQFKRNSKEFNNNNEVTPIFHQSRKKIVDNRLLKILPYLNKGDQCLDIGGGAGTFAQRVKGKVKNIEVLEIAPNLAKESQRLGFKTYQCQLGEVNNKYDITFLWHVLEHIEDINELLYKISCITKKYFIMEIPFGRNIPKKFDGHVQYFSEKSLNTVLGKYFKIININNGVQQPARMIICQSKENK